MSPRWGSLVSIIVIYEANYHSIINEELFSAALALECWSWNITKEFLQIKNKVFRKSVVFQIYKSNF